MKKKDLIFYAGAAVLMAVSAQGVSADELVSNEATTTEGNQVQAEKVPEVAVAEKPVAPVAGNYAAPANVTEQSVAPVNKVAASESGTPSVEKTTEASTTEKEETPLPDVYKRQVGQSALSINWRQTSRMNLTRFMLRLLVDCGKKN